MKQHLSIQNQMGMGFMAFAMFLGAGNLIFPPMAGYLAGEAVWQAAAGFLITGVGLPLLGIVTISKVGGGFNSITEELPRWLVILLGSTIFLIIGPLYAVPRTAMVAYEVGILPFLSESANTTSRLAFCLCFFLIAWYLCLKPGKLLETVGELITPALIILLFILGVSPFVISSDSPGDALENYSQTPFISGFLDGYLTMDALAALMFGVVIMTNLKSHGITDPGKLFRYSISTGVIAATGLGLVYLSLFYLGASSRGLIEMPDNGAQALALYVEQLFGPFGNILLAAVVILACLTTAIGCITAASEYFEELSERLSYAQLVSIISLSCVFFANLGLNQIIDLFIPVLFLLYPICIILILLGLIRHLLPNPYLTYRATLAIAFLFSLFDALKSSNINSLDIYLDTFNFLPGFNTHMGWLIPSTLCLLVSILLGRKQKTAEPSLSED
ncbi:branched-chain amino acid transport system II carrier protein [Endozoicomonas sp. Mp262]|uniref:branched-chain amino acid transport system II carrier protein n=1 Tax=Endozoicomonas sp. Mp262 TaxID=2919499 RepID=UPI0021DAD33B